MDDKTIKLRTWDSDSKTTEEDRETISVSLLARSITLGNFAALLDNFLNSGGKGFSEGQEVGCLMRSTHRTLQRLAICFAIGIIVGLSAQEYTDPRNELAIETAKKIAGMLDGGELPLGTFI